MHVSVAPLDGRISHNPLVDDDVTKTFDRMFENAAREIERERDIQTTLNLSNERSDRPI